MHIRHRDHLTGRNFNKEIFAINARRFGQLKTRNHILAQVVMPAQCGSEALQIPFGFLDTHHVRLRLPDYLDHLVKTDVRPAPLNIEGHDAQWNTSGRLRRGGIIGNRPALLQAGKE